MKHVQLSRLQHCLTISSIPVSNLQVQVVSGSLSTSKWDLSDDALSLESLEELVSFFKMSQRENAIGKVFFHLPQ